MPDAVVAEQPATRKAEAEQGCPVKMYVGHCGRPIYTAGSGVNKEPVCLMHSRDPDKDDAAFEAEFARTLRDAGEGVADFTKFVFPSANYRGRRFKPACIFLEATFTQGADFTDATFMQRADFRQVAFKEDTSFFLATFTQHAGFSEATFAQAADFNSATFTRDVDFSQATFTGHASFVEARFARAAKFVYATFTGAADFSLARFTQDAHFSGATFTQAATFARATFTREANFIEAKFAQAASFLGVTFMQDASFTEARLEREADFRRATFKERAEFRETMFRENRSAQPGPVFLEARFEKPELVTFYDTYLGQALLHNCDVSKFVFSKVRWRERSNGKRMVLEEDEKFDVAGYVTKALRTGKGEPDERNYGLIAELYQQLKKNYDDRKDYWTAGDFHYGEMEMKRLAAPNPNRLSRWIAERIETWLAKENPGFLARVAKSRGVSERSFHVLRRELHRHLGLAAWYRYASEYGESYGRPLLWLAGILVAFMFLYPWPGLRPSAKSSAPEPAASESRLTAKASTPELSYSNLFRHRSTEPGGPRVAVWPLLGHSAMTTIGVAAFQRDLAYEPTYPWGRLLAIVEILLTSTLLALFLLAVRRQFRR